MNESSCCSTLLSAFGVVSVLDFDHFNRYIVVSYCCFNLQFPKTCSADHLFIMLLCYLCVFFGDVSVQVFCSFFHQVVHFLIAELF
jgi:hypothetical protein